MSQFESKDTCELVSVEDEGEFREVIENNPVGLVMMPEEYGVDKELSLKSAAGDFSKWLSVHDPKIIVNVKETDRRIVLKSSDIWLPLVFLASNITLPIYLNLAANYVYDKMRGSLKGESTHIDLSVEFEDKKKGKIKRFNFKGNADDLQKVIKKIDLNQFFDEYES